MHISGKQVLITLLILSNLFWYRVYHVTEDNRKFAWQQVMDTSKRERDNFKRETECYNAWHEQTKKQFEQTLEQWQRQANGVAR